MRKSAKYITITLLVLLTGCNGTQPENSEPAQTISVPEEVISQEENSPTATNTEPSTEASIETSALQETTAEKQTAEEETTSASELELTLNIQCEKNLLLDKFDVNLYVDDEFVTKIAQGAGYANTLIVEPGAHVVRLAVADNESIFNEEKFYVKSNTMFRCELQTHSDNIEFKQVSIARDNSEQIVISMPDHELKRKDCEEVEKTLRAEGFTNIVTEPVYDIVFGVARERSVAEVIIGGQKWFNTGDVFDRDAEVKIVYHMKQEDSPSFTSAEE